MVQSISSGEQFDAPGSRPQAASDDPSLAPEGMLIRDEGNGIRNRVAVSYLRGSRRPRITVERQSWQVQTVYADGVPVVVIATAKPVGLAAEDVVLVER